MVWYEFCLGAAFHDRKRATILQLLTSLTVLCSLPQRER